MCSEDGVRIEIAATQLSCVIKCLNDALYDDIIQWTLLLLWYNFLPYFICCAIGHKMNFRL